MLLCVASTGAAPTTSWSSCHLEQHSCMFDSTTIRHTLYSTPLPPDPGLWPALWCVEHQPHTPPVTHALPPNHASNTAQPQWLRLLLKHASSRQQASVSATHRHTCSTPTQPLQLCRLQFCAWFSSRPARQLFVCDQPPLQLARSHCGRYLEGSRNAHTCSFCVGVPFYCLLPLSVHVHVIVSGDVRLANCQP